MRHLATFSMLLEHRLQRNLTISEVPHLQHVPFRDALSGHLTDARLANAKMSSQSNAAPSFPR